MTDTTVSRATLVKVAESFRELMLLRDRQAVTQAQVIRWCVQGLTQTSDQARARLERATRNGNPGHYRGNVPTSMDVARKVNEDKKLALLYLDWLTTSLEGTAPPGGPLTGVPATLE